jgi:hypothetical protein
MNGQEEHHKKINQLQDRMIKQRLLEHKKESLQGERSQE